MLPPVSPAHQVAERRKTIKARLERLQENDLPIQASRTLSEQPSIINRCEEANPALPSHWQTVFCFTRRAACHSVRSEESQIFFRTHELRKLEMFRVAQHDSRRPLLHFPKLDFLTKQLRITRVLVQKRNNSG
jgi:hypothetical protein